MSKIRNKRSISLVLLGVAASVFALPEDTKAVLYVHAGAAELNYHTHLGVYTGGVTLDQGSVHIRASQAITQGNATNQLVKATIMGDKQTQAHYWGLVTADKPLLHAYADKIIYYPLAQQVVLMGHARIEQGQRLFSAPLIRYSLNNQQIVTKNHPGEQTILIVHPETS